MDKVKVTIAVAIYNVPNNYLETCIESLRKQTLQDIEILLISDNSNEENLSLMKAYANKDERIRVIHNEKNKGLAGVRNQSIDEAKGEFLCFVDNDDWLDEHVCEVGYAKAINNNAEVVLWTYSTSLDGKNVHTNYRGPKEYLYETEEDLSLLRTQILDPTFDFKQQIPMAVTAWAKLYNVNFLRNNSDIRFPEQLGTGGEDYIFNYRIFGRLKAAYFVEDYGYYYRQFASSYTKKFRKNEWDNRMKWITSVKQYVPFEDEYQRKAFKRFCINEFIRQCSVTQWHPDAQLKYADKRNELKEIHRNRIIKEVLQEVGSLQLKKSKYIFMVLFKYRCYDAVLFLSKIYHKKNIG